QSGLSRSHRNNLAGNTTGRGSTRFEGSVFSRPTGGRTTFREGLHKLGWVEGQNIQIEFRWATTDVDRMQQFTKELVELRPDVIFSSGTPTTRLLIQQTRSIPIVFANLVDPVGSGFVTSLARPGGNVTGFVNLEASISGKYLELLKEIAPRVVRV